MPALNIELTIDGLDEEKLREGARIVALKVHPEWNENNVKFQAYKSGITNQLVGVWEDEENKQVLVRVYGQGTELFIDREAEKNNIEVLHKVGCAPKLLAVFTNGICYDFTVGIPTTTESIVQEPIWRSVAQEMAKLHMTEEDDKKKPSLFPKIRHFLNLVPGKFDPVKQERLEARKYTKNILDREISHLEKYLTALGCPIVFSHNDILLGNVIWDELKGSASFIDFEYCAANYQVYDIANHFNEFAGVDTVDYNLYPSVEFQYKWLRNYLSHFSNKSEAQIEEKEVEQYYIWTNKFALVSHLFWSCWALVQAHYSKIDFDFLEYAIIRLDEYFRRKDEFLALAPKE